jgi:hypothetical protein
LRQGSGVKQSPNQPVESVPLIDEYREYLSQERGFAERMPGVPLKVTTPE